MKIVVDRTRCASTGMCEALAPDVFEIGEDGALTIVQEHPAEDRRAEMENACMDCPTQALRIYD
ncbi:MULTISPECIES: ferredoxin [Mycobacterium]|uniref:ferredoxin n=1 Tax=Mycobacterium TaxID=1763 RepID=UPI000F03D9D1|nr:MULTISPECIES: ferredoxin [Mycobacterium]TDK98162.1 ferredoxin [Mycobacterium paragordonae]VAZ69692.1 Ferredoxin fas2 [Mycobacterium kansasii]